MLDNEQLREADNGVTYLKNVPRPFFVKGANHVFLWRFLQLFFRTYRGNMEIVHWIGTFEITMCRLRIAWADLLDLTIYPEIDDENLQDILTQQIAAIGAENDGARRREMAAQFPEEFTLHQPITDHELTID